LNQENYLIPGKEGQLVIVGFYLFLVIVSPEILTAQKLSEDFNRLF